MLKSLYFKIVLILLIFIIAVMCAVGAILMNGVTSFYTEEFTHQMADCFAPDSLLMTDLRVAAHSNNYATEMRSALAAYGSILGIDQYRNYYILDTDGEMIAGSDTALGAELDITPNILSAISGEGNNLAAANMNYSDWAVRIPGADENKSDCIIYIKDTLEEMRQLNSMLFSIILQAMLIGILIAVLLSFFLAKSISAPLQSLTRGTQLVAQGEFSGEIEVRSADEIGVLAENFNYMRERLRDTIDEVEGEKEKLDTVLSCMRDAVVAFTVEGDVLHSNSSATELFGDALENGTLTIEKCFEALDLPLAKLGNSIILSSPDIPVEKSRDGFIFRDRICGSRVYDVSFAVIKYIETSRHIASGCVFIIHDVTGRYELDESRREFVANVSHELRTPLTSIKGATETVMMDPEMDSETRDYFLDMVLSESDRMTRIVSDLLVLSRLDNKRTKWNIETFDFKNSVRRLCDVMKPDLEAHRHTVNFESDEVIPEITADRQRIEQVVINIMSNAIKYTPDGGRIDLRLIATPQSTLVLHVSDNGIGIPEDDIEHLFERFYRVEKSRTQDAGGTGLGLAIAKELAMAHGGNITVSSKLGEGTTVRLELPVECKLKTEENTHKQ